MFTFYNETRREWYLLPKPNRTTLDNLSNNAHLSMFGKNVLASQNIINIAEPDIPEGCSNRPGFLH